MTTTQTNGRFEQWWAVNYGGLPELNSEFEPYCREAFAAGYQAGLTAPATERYSDADIQNLGRAILADELAAEAYLAEEAAVSLVFDAETALIQGPFDD